MQQQPDQALIKRAGQSLMVWASQKADSHWWPCSSMAFPKRGVRLHQLSSRLCVLLCWLYSAGSACQQLSKMINVTQPGDTALGDGTASTLLQSKMHTHSPVQPACCLVATATNTPGRNTECV